MTPMKIMLMGKCKSKDNFVKEAIKQFNSIRNDNITMLKRCEEHDNCPCLHVVESDNLSKTYNDIEAKTKTSL